MAESCRAWKAWICVVEHCSTIIERAMQATVVLPWLTWPHCAVLFVFGPDRRLPLWELPVMML